jgi:hypothetical protein
LKESEASSGPIRAQVLIEWLAANRDSAMRFLAANRYRDLHLYGVAKAVAARTTPSEIVAIANAAEDPSEAVYQVGKWLSAADINVLAGMMGSVNSEAIGPATGAVASLLADLNVDRAIDFSLSLPTDAEKAGAISAVLHELRQSASGEAEVRALMTSLPPSVRSSDPVLFEIGESTWGSDPAAALQTLESIADPKTRNIALMHLSQIAASASPETAIAAVYAAPGLSDQGIYNNVSRILQNWSAVDPNAAANFLSKTQIIPPGDMPKYALIVVTPPPKG